MSKLLLTQSKLLLTQGKVALIDDEDFDYLNQWKWFAIKDSNTYYAGRSVKSTSGNSRQNIITLHRFIMKCKFGDGKIIDHKDRNGLNNQKSNLRFATYSQNSQNKKSKKNGSSKYLGVSFSKRKKLWEVRIKVNGKNKRIGYFKLEKEAAKVYNREAIIAYNEFANLNKF